MAWLDKHWPKARRVCPICDNSNWQIDVVSEMRTFNGGDMVIGGPQGGILAVSAVMCDRCGFMHLFNAAHAGIVQMSEYQQREPLEGGAL